MKLEDKIPQKEKNKYVAIKEYLKNDRINTKKILQKLTNIENKTTNKTIEHLIQAIKNKNATIEDIFIQTKELKEKYKGIGDIRIKGKKKKNTMLKPEFESVKAYAQETKKTLEKTKTPKKLIQEIINDIKKIGATTTGEILSFYTHTKATKKINTIKKNTKLKNKS